MEAKLSYNQTNFRIRLHVIAKHAWNDDIDPENFIHKTRNKLDHLVELGDIDIYYVFSYQFLQFWRNLKMIPKDNDSLITFDLGFGAKKIDMQLGPGNKNNYAFIKKVQEDYSGISFENFMVNVLCRLKEIELDRYAYDLGIRAAYYRWVRNNLITPYPLSNKKNQPLQALDVSATVNKSLKEGYLYVTHPSYFKSKEGLKELYGKAKAMMPKIKSQFANSIFLSSELMKEFKEELTRITSMGIDLPKVFVFAIDDPKRNKKKKANSHKLLKNPNDCFLKISVDDLAMEATITGCSKNVLTPAFTIDESAFIKELQSHGIVYGYAEFMQGIIGRINNNEELNGEVIAEGLHPKPGSLPYLHVTHLETELEHQEGVDIRSTQNRFVVDPGEIIAEARFQDGKSGLDVFGKEVHAIADSEAFKVRLGKNVTYDSQGRIASKIHGMPYIFNNKVDCSPVFIHQGDINLSSGNLEFDGSAEVRGNIESGASVTVTENLIVTGTIGQAFINCHGNLIVKGGIVTSERGLVEVGGRLQAEFVENSRITVGGDMVISQSVINSNVIVGGKLHVTAPRSGVIGGGVISARERVITGSLGFEEGQKTICRIGVDWVFERKITIQKDRLVRVADIEQKETKILNELKKQTSLRQDARKIEQRDKLQKRLDRIGPIRRKIEAKIKLFQSQLTWNRDAILIVNNLLSPNSEINVGNKVIPVGQQLKAVILTYHKLRNGRTNPIEYLSDFENRISGPKAS